MEKLPTAGADGWYLLHEGERHGPFPISAFIKAVEEGTITKDHLIWRPGWADWRSGRAAAELLGGPMMSADELLAKEVVEPAVAAALGMKRSDYFTPPPPPKWIHDAPETDSLVTPATPKTETKATGAEEAVADALKFMRSPGPREIETPPELEETTDPSVAWVNDLGFLHAGRTPTEDDDEFAVTSDHNYLTRHWLGELSLPKSWINMVLAITATSFSAFALQVALQNSGAHSGTVTFGAWTLFSVVVLAIVAWQLVGVWRSAALHHERGGSIFWARAAQAMIVVGVSAGVITAVADSSLFASSGSMAAAAANEKVRDALSRVPVYATLRRLDPGAFDTITEQVAAEFQRGDSDDVIFTEARSALGQTIRQYTPHASEDAILDMTEVLVGYMSALQASDPESCVALNDQSTGAQMRANLVKQFPAIFDRELEVNDRILSSAATSAEPFPDGSAVQEQLNVIQGQLTGRFQLGVLAKKNLAPSEYASYCQVALALLEEIRRLPPKQAADLLRYVYAQSS